MDLESLRPKLHRYCARMMGSVVDGEDVVQETLVHATAKLDTLKDPTRLEAWVFRIAHNKAIDHLRKRRVTEPWVEDARGEDVVEPIVDADVQKALSTLVTRLPPKERAAVLLKDVLDYSLAEVADIIDSTVGGIKAALHRGRTKLRDLDGDVSVRRISDDNRALIEAYVARFSAQDWDGVCAITRADARIDVVGFPGGHGHEFMRTGYFRNYSRLPPWRLGLAVVLGEEHVVQYRRHGDAWVPFAIQLLSVEGGEVVGVRDFVHVEYLLAGVEVRAFGRS